jgi:nucleoside-diphosphate-sugar epimerase
MQALIKGEPVIVFGDGQQSRGNTYVADCVRATMAAMDAPAGETYNIGGGETANVWEILHLLEELAGSRANVKQEAARAGDQRHTFADTRKIRSHLGWQPSTSLKLGLTNQWEWMKEQFSPAGKPLPRA